MRVRGRRDGVREGGKSGSEEAMRHDGVGWDEWACMECEHVWEGRWERREGGREGGKKQGGMRKEE